MRKGGKRSVSDGSGRVCPQTIIRRGRLLFRFFDGRSSDVEPPRPPPPALGCRIRSAARSLGSSRRGSRALVRTHSRSDQPSPPVSLERTYHSRCALKSRTNALESMDAPPSSPNTPARPAPRVCRHPRAPLPNRPAPSTSPALRPPPPVAPPRRVRTPPAPGRLATIPSASARRTRPPEAPSRLRPGGRGGRESMRAPGGSGRVAASSVRDPASANRSPIDRSRTRARSPPRWRVGFRTPRRRLRRFSATAASGSSRGDTSGPRKSARRS